MLYLTLGRPFADLLEKLAVKELRLVFCKGICLGNDLGAKDAYDVGCFVYSVDRG